MQKSAKKNARGGHREGAGRPAGRSDVGSITIRIPEDVAKILANQENKTAYIIEAVRAYALDIVYEDDTVLVVNKPAGLVVHPGHGNYSGTLVNALAWHFRDNPDYDVSDPRLGLVHRIDKDTSGLLVVAKTPDPLSVYPNIPLI